MPSGGRRCLRRRREPARRALDDGGQPRRLAPARRPGRAARGHPRDAGRAARRAHRARAGGAGGRVRRRSVPGRLPRRRRPHSVRAHRRRSRHVVRSVPRPRPVVAPSTSRSGTAGTSLPRHRPTTCSIADGDEHQRPLGAHVDSDGTTRVLAGGDGHRRDSRGRGLQRGRPPGAPGRPRPTRDEPDGGTRWSVTEVDAADGRAGDGHRWHRTRAGTCRSTSPTTASSAVLWTRRGDRSGVMIDVADGSRRRTRRAGPPGRRILGVPRPGVGCRTAVGRRRGHPTDREGTASATRRPPAPVRDVVVAPDGTWAVDRRPRPAFSSGTSIRDRPVVPAGAADRPRRRRDARWRSTRPATG